jgi:hypothetical protein
MKLFRQAGTYFLLASVIAVFAANMRSAFAGNIPVEQGAKLSAISGEVQVVLDDIEGQLAHAANQLSAHGIDGPEALEAMRQLCERRASFASCITLDAGGIVREVYPKRYSEIRDTDLSGQAHIARIFADKQPVMSGLFKAVEGFYAVEFGAPVFDRHHRLIGAVSAIVRPYEFLKQIIAPRFSWDALSIWVLEPNSVALFSKNKKLVGRSLKEEAVSAHEFTYVPLLLMIEKQETGTEHFLRRGKGRASPEPRQLDWTSVHFKDGFWRVVLVGPVSSQN